MAVSYQIIIRIPVAVPTEPIENILQRMYHDNSFTSSFREYFHLSVGLNLAIGSYSGLLGSALVEAVKAVVAEVWQPTRTKHLRMQEILSAWRKMTQPTYRERRLVAPGQCSVYARNRFKSRVETIPYT